MEPWRALTRLTAMTFSRFTTGTATAKTHLRVAGFQLTPYGSKAPKAACGAKVTRSYVPMPDTAPITCERCHA